MAGNSTWSRDGAKLAIGGSFQAPRSHVQVFDAQTGVAQTPWDVPKATAYKNSEVIPARSHKGDRIAACCREGTICLLDARDGAKLAQSVQYKGAEAYNANSNYFFCADRSPLWSLDDKHILLACQGVLLLLDSSDARWLREYDVAISPQGIHFLDDSTVLVATLGGEVLRLNLTTGDKETVSKFAGAAVQFSPDGKYLACDLANTRRVVRVSDGQLVFSLGGNDSLVSPEGHLWTPANPRGAAWGVALEGRFVYVIETASGRQTLTPTEFANKYGWQNDPAKVRLK